MKVALTCGHANSGFRIAHELLVSAGLRPIQAPVNPEQGWPGDFQAVAERAEQTSDEMASGWAANYVARLLDTWAECNPLIDFVLVYSSPQYALAQALQGRVASHEVVEHVVADWLACNDELLRFYNRHSDRCVLVDVVSVVHAPVQFLEHVSQTLGLPLNHGQVAEVKQDPGGEQAIAASLAQALVNGHRDAEALLCELASQASLDPAAHSVAQQERILAWQQYASLLASRTQQADLVVRLQDRLDRAEREGAEQSALAAERNALLNQARESAEQEAQSAAQLRLQVAAVGGENDLLLLQLHQVQEELEALYLRTQAEAEASKAELERSAQALAEQTQLAASRLAEAKAASDRAGQQAKLAQERQMQLHALTQAQAELEKNAQERQAQVQTLSRAKAAAEKTAAERAAQIEQLSKARDEQAKLAQEHQAQLQVACAERDRQSKLAAQKAQELAALTEQTKLLQQQIQQTRSGLDEQARLASARLAEAEAAVDAAGQLTKLAEERQVELWRVTAERDQQGVIAGQLEARLAAAERSMLEQAALAAEREALLEQMRLSEEREAINAAQRDQRGIELAREAELVRLQLQQTQSALEEQTALASARLADSKAVAEEASQLAKLAEDLQAQLRRVNAERDQQAAQCELLRLQADALTKEVATLRAERDRQPDPAQYQEQVKELAQENELLLLQLHQVLGELEHYFQQQRELAAKVQADEPVVALIRQHWANNQPDELVLDLRSAVTGRNWHDIEADGRWAGPELVSSLMLPAMRSGLYSIQLEIADAMDTDILEGMTLLLNGVPVETETVFDGFPALVLGSANVETGDCPTWELQLRFPRVMTPRERGEDDERMLAIRLRSVTLTLLEAL